MEPKANILVVDDNPDKLSLLEAALCLAGYRVTTATDGDEALSAIESYQPDLVITDVMMPRMNGYELLSRIRSDDSLRSIPVVFLTSRSAAKPSSPPHLPASIQALASLRYRQ